MRTKVTIGVNLSLLPPLLFLFLCFIIICPVRAAALEAAPPAVEEVARDAAGKVIAKVGEIEISESDLEESLQQKLRTSSGFLHAEDLSKKPSYRKDSLNELIDFMLFYHEALKRGITIPEDSVTLMVEGNIKKLGSETAVLQLLKARGLTMQSFQERIRRNLLVQKLLKDLSEKSIYAEEDLKKYYEENSAKLTRPDSLHIFMIYLKLDQSSSKEEWQKKADLAETLLKRLKAGEEFYDIAYRNSEDAYRVKGGDYGFIHRGTLVSSELENAAFSLQPGDISNVIRTIHGFYIMKAGEKRLGEKLDFSEFKAKYAKKLQQDKFEKTKSVILKQMREEYPIKVYITFDLKP